VPFVFCALFVAAIIGKIGVSRWIGMSFVHEDPENRLHAVRSFAIGSVVIVLVYMVPILGFITWTLGGMFGLGAASLAFIRAYRRENPAAPRPIPVTPAPAPAAASSVAGSSFNTAVAESPVAQYEALPDLDQPVMAAATVPLVAGAATLPHAPFLDRFAAFFLDVILVMITVQIFSWGNDDDTARMFFVTLLAYHVGFWTWKATTVGGIICQLRVIRVDGTPVRFVDALVRGLSAIFSLAMFGLGALWILKDPERQAWHDRIASTYVVKVPRNWPI
jgi:uncharacterized RDD family membrane protein YckC